MRIKFLVAGLMLGAGGMTAAQAATQITIATVNNPDMQTMEKLAPAFEKSHPDIKVNFVTLPENEVRQKMTTDIATNAGQYDALMISNYEVPIWAKNGWLVPFDNVPASYDESDMIPTVKKALSANGKLYAMPFYAESSMTYYRKDLFKKAGLTMPEHPKWSQIQQFAKKLNDPKNNTYGICLRGLPGWGENMALFSTMVNSYGGRWFDMNWKPQLTSSAWKKAATEYKNLVTKYGPPGVTSNGFTESETLFANGQCAMWVDSTVAAGYLSDPANSKVAKDVGFAQSPYATTKKGSHWLYSWALAVPKSSNHKEAAKTFIEWATSKKYIDLVGQKKGWVSVPPGTRKSTYENAEYKKVAPFASLVLNAIQTADPKDPSAKPVPYTGIQFVDIPPFQAIGTRVGQILAGIVAGQTSVDQGLSQANSVTKRMMQQAGYPKK
ncbi:ABC transporter substrate-binding protein [Salinisphaera hydrothermalis]|uniref:Family 1 extracellular solute-binding protein n=1 Tax=Salinisphaera hydrothermalis (strain C41B8) TaxID=1304275 RepID=A0A084IIS7_SALHC|nr:sugar ABC transporter substrate-binding protein [Salinisphaera hydrothermalis]KEZ76611.1 family 1 extracellular solute-binding protein [Salinisphaera hydrothermalis C41B8]